MNDDVKFKILDKDEIPLDSILRRLANLKLFYNFAVL